ncbi:hypothetical protein JOD27_003716 [Lentzea nigeriaca]|nr:hypothetical protein [Lentzea nigeriaca]
MKMLSIALAAIALGAVTVAPASAAPEGNEIVEIKNVLEGLCLDFNEPATTRPALTACTGSATQQFERIPAADGRGEFLRSVGGRWCLDGTFSYWIALRGNCDTDKAGHRFELEPQPSGSVKLKNQGEFIDAWSWRGRGELTMETPNSTGYQDWQIRRVGVAPKPELAAVVRPKSAGWGKCVAEDGPVARITACGTTQRETYQRLDAGDGKVALRNSSSGRCLSTDEYYEVDLVNCATGARDQQWTLVADELGRHRVRSELTGNYLEETDGLAKAYPYYQGLWQKWELTAAWSPGDRAASRPSGHRPAVTRWAASLPEMSTGGTPTPGVVPAPANATFSTPLTTLRGRNGPVCAKVCASPNGVPSALPQSRGVTRCSSRIAAPNPSRPRFSSVATSSSRYRGATRCQSIGPVRRFGHGAST